MVIACEAAGPMSCPPGTVLSPDEPCTLEPDLINAPACNVETCCKQSDSAKVNVENFDNKGASGSADASGTAGHGHSVPVLPPQAITCDSSGFKCPDGYSLINSASCTLEPDLIQAPACDLATCCTFNVQLPTPETSKSTGSSGNNGNAAEPVPIPKPMPESFTFMGPDSNGGNGNIPGPVPIPKPQPITCDSAGIACPAGQTLIYSQECSLDPDLVPAPACEVTTCCEAVPDGSNPQQPQSISAGPSAPISIPVPRPITCRESGLACPDGLALVNSNPCTFDTSFIDAPLCDVARCCGPADANASIPTTANTPLPITCDAAGITCPAGQTLVFTNICTHEVGLVDAPPCNTDNCCQ